MAERDFAPRGNERGDGRGMMGMKKRVGIVLLVLLALIALGLWLLKVYVDQHVLDRDGMVNEGYVQITQEEARDRMAGGEDYILLEVRTQAESAEGHIPGAICVPNETIGSEPPAELPDRQQTILVYCRSGRRSKEAAQKLADMGYRQVLEFGGIVDWTAEIEK